jgi:hypothetical protein
MDWTDRRKCEGIGQDANGLTDKFGDFRIESAEIGDDKAYVEVVLFIY